MSFLIKKSQKYILYLIILIQALILTSCGPKDFPKIDIGNNFYYWVAQEGSTPGDAMRHASEFKKLEDRSIHNLKNIAGKGSHYVWIRAEFEVPPEFRGQPLGLVVPHLQFAEMLWLNGTFVSMFGRFPPHEQSTLYKSHFFNLPPNMLDQRGGKNTILIKIYVHGRSGISTHSFISPSKWSFASHEIINFHHTRMYMFFEGTLVFTFLLFLILYLNLGGFREYLDFALMNFVTMLFIVPFFATELPAYTTGAGMPFNIFIKITLCIPICMIGYLTTSFNENFLREHLPKSIKWIRRLILFLQILAIVIVKDYDKLMTLTPAILFFVVINLLFGLHPFIKTLLNSEKRWLAIQVIIGFTPLTLSIITDFLLRVHDNTIAYSYFTIIGWQFSILIFIIILSIRFSKVYKHNELLTNHLQEEVDSRTHDLQGANYELSILNERLEKEKFRADMDLQMASLIQQRFFPQPDRHFKGWDISIYYSPQAIVSGDMYDYYNFNDDLNGLSLFDVSGHGISASLVTMLSKNIISHTFQKGYMKKESIHSILTRINNEIIQQKGDIDNYMTGILCRFTENKNDNTCHVEIGNAGHPYPLKFTAKTGEVTEIRDDSEKKHFGAIGMQGIAVSFADSDFTMATGDILIFFTDGLTEATNPQLGQFGTEELKTIIKVNRNKSTEEILKIIRKRLSVFIQNKPLEDDITIIIAKRTDPDNFVPEDEPEVEMIIEPKDEQIEELQSAE